MAKTNKGKGGGLWLLLIVAATLFLLWWWYMQRPLERLEEAPEKRKNDDKPQRAEADAAPQAVMIEVDEARSARASARLGLREDAPAPSLDSPVLREAAPSEAPIAPKPLGSVAAPQAEADDLTRIWGVGPTYREALGELGIHSFSDLAAADADALLEAFKQRNIRVLKSLSSWPQQAALLAAGDAEGHAALIAQLKAKA